MFIVGDKIMVINQDISGFINECEYDEKNMDNSYYWVDLGYGIFGFEQCQLSLVSKIKENK